MDTRDKYDALVKKAIGLFATKYSCWSEMASHLADEIDQLAKEMAMTNVLVFSLIVDDVEAQLED